MSRRWRQLKTGVSYIWQAFQVFALLAGALGLSVLGTIAGGVCAFLWEQWLVLGVFGAFSLGLLLASAFSYLRYVHEPFVQAARRGYRLVRAEYIYTILDDVHHQQTIRIKIRALRDGVRDVECRYSWTGGGREADPQVLSTGHRLMGRPTRHHMWKVYRVEFARELLAGEEADVEILQDLWDTERQFAPWLTKAVLESIDYLVLRVVLPVQKLPASATYTEYADTTGDVKLVSEELPINSDTGEIAKHISKPNLRHSYGIYWGT